ncbi:MAG: L-2-amino-thiazoline-4-carboxylic acid hydrolase [Pseudomonadota bacterium]
MPYSQQNFAYRLRLSDRLAIRHFRKGLPRQQGKRFGQSFAAIMQAEKPFCDHPTTQSLTIFAASALASYRVLLAEGTDVQTAKELIGKSIKSIGRRTSRVMMWLMTNTSRDMFESVRRYSRDTTPRFYGLSFDIGFEDGDADSFTSVVSTCGFKTILDRHGAPELLESFCEWDRNWIEALPPGIRFNRPKTIAKGAGACRFEFERG